MKENKIAWSVLLPLVAAPLIATAFTGLIGPYRHASDWPRLVFTTPFWAMFYGDGIKMITPFVMIVVLTSLVFAVIKRSRKSAWIASSVFAIYWLLMSLLMNTIPWD